ncbi:hypothetical protein GBAR_LOCUS25579 [Geodia barretti]|uniref:Uncharacterized protein n=1 Tax=Geodia barretti TaxID=519541 RepID=A0AA35TEJ2_GEOBA|nr:hypothetical protein GBAR_LOCUS25579 [Geodia barretti]
MILCTKVFNPPLHCEYICCVGHQCRPDSIPPGATETGPDRLRQAVGHQGHYCREPQTHGQRPRQWRENSGDVERLSGVVSLQRPETRPLYLQHPGSRLPHRSHYWYSWLPDGWLHLCPAPFCPAPSHIRATGRHD